MRDRVTQFLGAAALSLLVACGGGGTNDTNNVNPNPPPPGNLGPSGTTCTTQAACGVGGGTPVSCFASVGANTPVIATDFDYVLNRLNTIRTTLGLTAFTRTAALDAFAQAGSNQLMADHTPHAHFAANAAGDPAFTGFRAENQGSPNGWFTNATTTQIDEIINCMMNEEFTGPAFEKGHWYNIVCPCYVKVGIGLVKDGAGELYFTIDFSQ